MTEGCLKKKKKRQNPLALKSRDWKYHWKSGKPRAVGLLHSKYCTKMKVRLCNNKRHRLLHTRPSEHLCWAVLHLKMEGFLPARQNWQESWESSWLC